MKTYKLIISSNINSNIEYLTYFNSELNEGVLLDILTSITPYKLTIIKYIPSSVVPWSLEDIARVLPEIKLTTKVAKNVTKINIEQIATFREKPCLDLNIWEGDLGEIRTYVNNKYSIIITSTIFPGLFKTDMKSNKAYYPGKLILDHDPIANNYTLTCVKSVDTVIYEEITLEK